MSQTYNIFINSGVSPGPYTIYFDSVGLSNIAIQLSGGSLASGLTLNELQIGVSVEVPDFSTQIIVFNESCGTSKIFEIEPKKQEYPCLCMKIIYTNPLDNLPNEQYIFCYQYTDINGRPRYETDDCKYLTWKGTFWEFEGYGASYKIRSFDNDDIPDTAWFTQGANVPNSFILVTQGQCTQGPEDYFLIVEKTNPICIGQSNGSIDATAYGGSGGWTYSLDNVNYVNSTGIFNTLTDGLYTVYAKDSSNNIVSEVFTLTGQPQFNYYINGITSIKNLSPVGNMNYYQLRVDFDTSQIPIGETISFDMTSTYNLFYQNPGSALFNVTQISVKLNDILQSTSVVSTLPLTQNSISPCNVTYFGYVGEFTYETTSITLTKNDVFYAEINYGIDTKTQGVFINPCYTSASLNVSILFKNIVESCDCCKFINNQINSQPTIQNYQP